MSQGISIIEESLPDGFSATHESCGETEQGLLAVGLPIRKYAIVRADDGNGAALYIGPRGHAGTGFKLLAGEISPPIYLDHSDKIGIVSASGTLGYRVVSQ